METMITSASVALGRDRWTEILSESLPRRDPSSRRPSGGSWCGDVHGSSIARRQHVATEQDHLMLLELQNIRRLLTQINERLERIEKSKEKMTEPIGAKGAKAR
jgi:hypothetical protein